MTKNSSFLNDIHKGNDTTNDRLEMKSKHINASFSTGQFYFKGSFNENIEEFYGGLPSISDGTQYLRRNNHFKMGCKNQVTPFFFYDINLMFNQFSLRVDFDWNSPGHNFTRGNSTTYEIEGLTVLNFSKYFDITNGFCLRKTNDLHFFGLLDKLNIYSIDNVDDNIKTISFFSQANYMPHEKFKLVIGCRFEKLLKYDFLHEEIENNPEIREYDQDYIEFIPRLAAIYKLTPNHIFKLLYGKANSRPSFFQIRDQIIGKKGNLQSEYIQTFELNYQSLVFQNVLITSSLFYNILDNLIERKLLIEDNRVTIYGTNGGKLITKGMEFSTQINYPTQLKTEFSLTWQQTDDQRNLYKDTEVPYSPHFLGYVKASYEFKDNYLVSITANYVDDMVTQWDEAHVNPDGSLGGRVGEKTDDYFLVNATFRKDNFFQKGCFLSIHGSNIFDKSFLHPTNSANFFEKGSIGQGRLLMLTVGMNF